MDNKRAFTINDIENIRTVSSPQLSPDGKSGVFVITSLVEAAPVDNIILVDLYSGVQTKIAEGSVPQWSFDGSKIGYVGNNAGNSALFLHDPANNSNELLVDIYESDYFIDHYSVMDFRWSPDGKSIAYISSNPRDENIETSAVREFTDLLYKTKGGRGRRMYSDKQYNHIWLVSIEEKVSRQVFKSDFNEHSISWSQDSKKLCFISNTTGNPDQNQWSDVFGIDVLSGEVNKISNEKGSSFQPTWSPDGLYIAYLGIKSEVSTNDSPAEDTQLYLIPSAGGPARCLTSSLDRRIEQLSWSHDSQYIYFTAGDAGNTFLHRVCLSSGEIEIVINIPGKVLEYSLRSSGETILYIHTNAVSLPDLFIHPSNKRLTSTRGELSNMCALQPAEMFWFKSFDGTNVQGWLIKPFGFREGLKYPLILVIHGGPHNMFGDEFEDRMQLLSANGYGVFFINPRGSTGYGQQFSNGCLRAWGEGDYEDLMSGLDAAIENNAWISETRLGVTGQSYGGYMTNRIITKTNRFKAAVADGSISNLISFAGTSLYHSLPESEFGGAVHDNYDLLWKCSPLKDVKNVKTPVLFLHGETDNEVPFSQAEEMFSAVKKLGVPTKLVQYVGEGHGWRPDLTIQNKKDLLQRMLNWFEQYV